MNTDYSRAGSNPVPGVDKKTPGLKILTLALIVLAAVLFHNWFKSWLHNDPLAGFGPLPLIVKVDLDGPLVPVKDPSKRRWLTSDLVARRLDQ